MGHIWAELVQRAARAVSAPEASPPSGPPGGPPPEGPSRGRGPRRPGPVQPMRAAAVIVVAVAVAVFVLVRMGGAPSRLADVKSTSTTLAHTTSTLPATTVTTVVATTSTTTTVPPSSVTVLVLNGWSTSHAALYFKNALAAHGYDTRAPSNALSETNKTSELFVTQPAFRDNALGIAALLHLPASAVVAPDQQNDAAVPAADLTGADLVLLVGEDISGQVPSGYKG